MTIDQDGQEDISSKPFDTLPHRLPYYATTIKSHENWEETEGRRWAKTTSNRNPSDEVVKICERNI